VIARAEVLSGLGLDIRAMALEDVLVTKLMALSEPAAEGSAAAAAG
jgi:hypothetical protein